MTALGASHPGAPRKLIRDVAYEAIREAILNGVLHPGERLDDAELQRWLGISRTPIRQALFALTIEGLVETAPQSHTRVVKPRVEEASSYLEAIGVLITGVTTASVRVATPNELGDLIDRIKLAIAAIDARDVSGFTRRITDYFLALEDLCPNESLTDVVERSARSLGYKALVLFKNRPIDWASLRASHVALLRALQSGALEEVERATRGLFASNPLTA
ncbi:GntR family transcriptional regulator [Leifsonia soli]|uniref:DNA-binding GntR family transcriptional regulator n=1 Tax=Leifsonia soli TaxID=582665 RepID=A0A852T380_9MICO|nr:GntR family transcriptional regulator [Leifsonia soli]NYD76106.1 DNA-binding GntR family transcriptional regulator [Leifsonia soli]